MRQSSPVGAVKVLRFFNSEGGLLKQIGSSWYSKRSEVKKFPLYYRIIRKTKIQFYKNRYFDIEPATNIIDFFFCVIQKRTSVET